MLQTPLTIQRLYDDNRESLQLGWFAGFPGGERLISGDVASAADQVGHLNLIHPGRIQVFGHQEINYYQRLKVEHAHPRDRRTDRRRPAGADHRARAWKRRPTSSPSATSKTFPCSPRRCRPRR